jgi:hypothetical protein
MKVHPIAQLHSTPFSGPLFISFVYILCPGTALGPGKAYIFSFLFCSRCIFQKEKKNGTGLPLPSMRLGDFDFLHVSQASVFFVRCLFALHFHLLPSPHSFARTPPRESEQDRNQTPAKNTITITNNHSLAFSSSKLLFSQLANHLPYTPNSTSTFANKDIHK